MKKILVYLISALIAFIPAYVFANSSFGGWTIGGLVADGASSTVNGTKQVIIDGKDYIKKGTAKITPAASQVSKVLARGAAGYALSIAVEQLLGSVDWVLDPANNRITYYENDSNCTTFESCTAYPQLYSFGTSQGTKYYPSLEIGCTAVTTFDTNWSQYTYYSSSMISPTVGQCNFRHKQYADLRNWDNFYQSPLVTNPAYNPEAEQEQKTLPLDVVSAQVISNAEAEDAHAKSATTAAAQDIINDAEQDETKARPIVQQLEASASTENADSSAQDAANDATGTSQPNTANPEATDISLEFPTFCGWAPLVCEAAQVAISFPNTLTNWWTISKNAISASWTTFTQWLNWTKQDTDLPDTENVQISELPTPEITENYISWGASCPADVQIPISLQGVSSTLTFSWSPWCQLLSIIRPAIVASAYIGAAFIVLGLRT